MNLPAVAGVVLCGGRSARMGRPKAALPWRGRTLLEHAVAVLAPVCSEVLVVSTPGLELPPVDVPVVVDREPGLGPLAGLREALHAAGAPLVFVSPVDHPFITADLVHFLAGRGRTTACRVGGIVQPLPAVYERALAPAADALLAAGRRRPQDLLDEAGATVVEEHELPDAAAFLGCNTPEEYAAALRRDAGRGRAAP